MIVRPIQTEKAYREEAKRAYMFVAEDGADPLKIVAETEAVFLDVDVTEFGDECAQDRVGIPKVDDFHIRIFNCIRNANIAKKLYLSI